MNADDRFTLVDVLRSVPTLSANDSLQRFVDISGYAHVTVLPVVDGDILVGYMHLNDAMFMLRIENRGEREIAGYQPVSDFMRPAGPTTTIDVSASYAQAEQICADCGIDLVAVVDAGMRLYGVVICRDFLTGVRLPLRLPTIGGMATPFGVYLSDGTSQAGANNFALVASGAALGFFATLASATVQAALLAFSKAFHTDLTYLTADYIAPTGHIRLGIMALLAHLCTTVVFLTLVRFSRIAGYHAAEHQTVHAVEKGEALVPEVVSRMPRPHPRCGTNIMAAGILFWNLSALFRAFPGSDADTATIGAIVITFFNWRRFGTFLQAVFTTKPASLKEIQSGIRAATMLQEKYRRSTPGRMSSMRRLWCSGMLQSILGLIPTLALLSTLMDKFFSR